MFFQPWISESADTDPADTGVLLCLPNTTLHPASSLMGVLNLCWVFTTDCCRRPPAPFQRASKTEWVCCRGKAICWAPRRPCTYGSCLATNGIPFPHTHPHTHLCRSLQKNACVLPEDLKNFYLMTDGFHMTWSVKVDGKFA